MINHARTLLLNQAATDDFSVPAEEYVEPTFTPVVLPRHLAAVRRALFGDEPDRALLNLRIQRYLSVIHATELVQHVLFLDPRVTYTTPCDAATMQLQGSPQIKQIDGAPLSLAATGQFSLYRNNRASWDITVWIGVLTATSFLLDGRRIQPTQGLPAVTAGEIPLVDHLSAPVRLLDTSVDLRWTVPAGTPDDVYAYRIRGVAPDTASLPRLLTAVQALDPSVLANLFLGGGYYDTFRNLYEKHPFFPYRLSGLLLALIYKTEELRTREAL